MYSNKRLTFERIRVLPKAPKDESVSPFPSNQNSYDYENIIKNYRKFEPFDFSTTHTNALYVIKGMDSGGKKWIYIGQLMPKTHIKDGIGILVWEHGHVYEGYFKQGHRYGKGRYFWPDGKVYEGEWMDSSMHGQGR